jgi:THO complex subunit 7
MPRSTRQRVGFQDSIIHTRITNDERPLRRVIKKFHNYTALAFSPVVPIVRPWSGGQSSKDEAREAFLVELASFQLSLKKSAMICEAEARQVEEYKRERQRIGALDLSHVARRFRISYPYSQISNTGRWRVKLRSSRPHWSTSKLCGDEKLNTISWRRRSTPSLVEPSSNCESLYGMSLFRVDRAVSSSIQALENDMMAIRTEHGNQNRMIQGQKAALDSVIRDLGSLRLMGKEKDTTASVIPSPSMTPAPEGILEGADSGGHSEDTIAGAVSSAIVSSTGKSGEMGEEIQEDKASSDEIALASAALNPAAKLFLPTFAGLPTKPASGGILEHGDDIEMGEVEEPKYVSNKGRRNRGEELEEGEASDLSSDLSDPPDD